MFNAEIQNWINATPHPNQFEILFLSVLIILTILWMKSGALDWVDKPKKEKVETKC
jgi:hypothetical protein